MVQKRYKGRIPESANCGSCQDWSKCSTTKKGLLKINLDDCWLPSKNYKFKRAYDKTNNHNKGKMQQVTPQYSCGKRPSMRQGSGHK